MKALTKEQVSDINRALDHLRLAESMCAMHLKSAGEAFDSPQVYAIRRVEYNDWVKRYNHSIDVLHEMGLIAGTKKFFLK